MEVKIERGFTMHQLPIGNLPFALMVNYSLQFVCMLHINRSFKGNNNGWLLLIWANARMASEYQTSIKVNAISVDGMSAELSLVNMH